MWRTATTVTSSGRLSHSIASGMWSFLLISALNVTADVAIHGILEQASLRPPLLTNTYEFTFCFASNSWLSSVRPTGSTKPWVSIDRVVTFCDGEEVKEVSIARETSVTHTSEVNPGSNPLHGPGFSVPLWLTFRLYPTIRGQEEYQCIAPWQKAVSKGIRSRGEIDRAVELTTCSLVERTDKQVTLNFWDGRFTNCSPAALEPSPRAQLSLKDFTNSFGLRLPSYAELRFLNLDERGQKFIQSISWYFRLHVHQFEQASVAEFAPTGLGRVVVRDRRFDNELKDGRSLKYAITNAWLSTNDKTLKGIVANVKSLPPRAHRSGRVWSKPFAMFVIFSVVAFPSLLYLYRRARGGTK